MRKGDKIYILVIDCKVMGAWTNFKKLCLENKDIEGFPSYHTLARKKPKDEGEINFDIDDKPYTIHLFIIK